MSLPWSPHNVAEKACKKCGSILITIALWQPEKYCSGRLFFLPILIFIIIGFRENANHLLVKKVAAQNAEWQQYDYVNIRDESISNRVKMLIGNAVSQVELEPQQELSLNMEIISLFLAYSQGTYEAYRFFRTPSGVPFVWESNQYGPLEQQLKYPGLPDVSKLSMDEKFKKFLLLLNRDGTVYSNYFVGVCFDRSGIVIRQLKSPIEPAWTTSFFPTDSLKQTSIATGTNFPNLQYMGQKGRFSFIYFTTNSIDNVVNRGGSVTAADCFFFIKRRAPYPILPLIVRFYWDPRLERWLPDDMIVCDLVEEKLASWPDF